MVQLVFGNFAAEGVAVNAKDLRGAGLIAVISLENALDETLFELPDGFVKQDSPFHHL